MALYAESAFRHIAQYADQIIAKAECESTDADELYDAFEQITKFAVFIKEIMISDDGVIVGNDKAWGAGLTGEVGQQP